MQIESENYWTKKGYTVIILKSDKDYEKFIENKIKKE